MSKLAMRNSFMIAYGWLVPAALAFALLLAGVEAARAAIVDSDPLELAIAPPADAVKFKDNAFEVSAADAFSYDDNIYRLAPSVTNLQGLAGIGPNASRQDHINTVTLAGDGAWNLGRQTFVANLRVDDNRYNVNSNLNNVSTNDKLIWNWNVGSVLSGQVGAIYSNGLISFVNSTNYARNLYAVTEYYGAGRYQIGPHWAIFGGVLQSGTTLSDPALRANDVHTKSVDFGSEFATSENDSLGAEYRYTDARYPPGTALNNDYREDTARFVVRHAFSEKTKIDANFGFLKRNYASATIAGFSGDVWRLGVVWKPTEKMQFEAAGWRNLQAYVTAQSDYFVDRGQNISARWTVTEKIAVTGSYAYENQNYIGVGLTQLLLAARRDSLSTPQAGIKYTPFQFLVFDFGYAYEKRNSNISGFQYNDHVISAKVTVKH
jgi:hypothetical protein